MAAAHTESSPIFLSIPRFSLGFLCVLSLRFYYGLGLSNAFIMRTPCSEESNSTVLIHPSLLCSMLLIQLHSLYTWVVDQIYLENITSDLWGLKISTWMAVTPLSFLRVFPLLCRGISLSWFSHPFKNQRFAAGHRAIQSPYRMQSIGWLFLYSLVFFAHITCVQESNPSLHLTHFKAWL